MARKLVNPVNAAVSFPFFQLAQASQTPPAAARRLFVFAATHAYKRFTALMRVVLRSCVRAMASSASGFNRDSGQRVMKSAYVFRASSGAPDKSCFCPFSKHARLRPRPFRKSRQRLVERV